VGGSVAPVSERSKAGVDTDRNNLFAAILLLIVGRTKDVCESDKRLFFLESISAEGGLQQNELLDIES